MRSLHAGLRPPGTTPRAYTRASLAFALVLGAALHSAPTAVAADATRAHPPGADAALGRVFEAIRQNRRDAALTETDRLIAAYPNFRLAHLIRGDLLLARTKPLDTFGNTAWTQRAGCRICARKPAFACAPTMTSLPQASSRAICSKSRTA